MVSAKTLLTCPYWKIPFIVPTDANDKQLGAVISQNKKPIAFFSRQLTNSQLDYTTTKKELIAIVQFLKKICGILFGYEINVFSCHTNLVYAATLSEYKNVMRWRLIIEEFGPNIHHIAGVDKVVSDILSRFPYTSIDK